MRVLVQRVSQSSVMTEGRTMGHTGLGLVLFLGIEDEDQEEDIRWLCGKITRLRIFDDADGVMNLSVKDVAGDILVISQFTLHASTKKGNRPSYIRAAKPEIAIPLYENFIKRLSSELGRPVRQGVFGAHMQVSLVNDGPVTLWIDSRNKE